MRKVPLELEELRKAGNSRSGLRWVTNPVRNVLFRLTLPYFEVIARALDQQDAEPAKPAPEAPALSQAQLAEAAIWVREEALAGVRAELRRELAGVRTEMRAMSHRFTSIEEMLHTNARWLDGVESHNAALAEEMRSEFAGLRQRIETAERIALAQPSADSAAAAVDGHGLFLASGPYGRFLVRHPDVVGDTIIRGEFWDPHLKEAIEVHADPERMAIDAGAYVGFHSVFLSHHFARVHAFEPQSQAYSLLRTNIELNGRRNIEPMEVGLYSHPCWLRLAPDELQEIPVPRANGSVNYNKIGNAAALAFVKTEERTADAVRAVTIDSFDFDRVGFIKIDTQGADFRVLQGAEETIRRCRPVIAFEFERDLSNAHGTLWEEVETFFRGGGYNLTEVSRTPGGKQADYLACPT
jgi:FkbM family methyltransferase